MILRQYATILTREIKEDNADLLYSLTQMFDTSKTLYSSSPIDLIHKKQVELPRTDEWKESVKNGDIIDVFYTEKEEGSISPIHGWRRAEVIVKASDSIIVRLLNTYTSL